MRRQATALVLSFGLVGCGDKGQPASDPTPRPSAPAAPLAPAPATDHGESKDLGHVTIAGHEFSVIRLGEVVPGKEAAFEAALVTGPAGATVGTLNVYAWVEDESGPASAPSKGSVEKGRLHFHVTTKADAKAPKRIVLRLRAGTIDERQGLPLDGHGHEHGAAPHEGVVATFGGPGGKPAGHLELKLHDDKGDLELWLARDAKLAEPFDLPLDAVIRVEFVDVGGRTVDLRARNAVKNEDEAGTANVRGGGTNYFIFPGDTGADATWLMGVKFSSIVRLRFTSGGVEHLSEEFMLVPHTHADGHGHR